MSECVLHVRMEEMERVTRTAIVPYLVERETDPFGLAMGSSYNKRELCCILKTTEN